MAKKAIAARVDEGVHGFYKTLFGTTNAGCEYVLQAFPNLYKRTIRKIARDMSTAELMLLIDSFNGTLLSPQMAGQGIIGHVEDAILLDGLADKWGVDGDALVKRLSDMSPFELSCLELWPVGYWEVSETVKLEAYIDDVKK